MSYPPRDDDQDLYNSFAYFTDDSSLAQIRKIMPKEMVGDLVGVSPMQGPKSSIFELRKKYDNNQ